MSIATRRYRLSLVMLVVGFTAINVLAAQPTRVPVMLNWDYNCQTLSPSDITKLVEDAKNLGADGINLRISNKGALNCRSKAGGPYTERLDAFGPDYDPLEILVRECRRVGIASCVWCDLFEAAYDPLILEHPEFSPQGRPGKPHLSGFPCYSHQEVRDHMLAIVDDFAAYKPDYVFFCTKSSHVPRNHLNQPHNRDSGFNPPVVEKYQERYGVDIRTEKFDRKKMGEIRGDFLVDYLVEAKRRLNQAGVKVIVGATVSGLLQPGGPNLRLDWREIVRRHAADVLLMANSRGEYYAFYDEKGQKLYREIVDACHKADMKFYAYIISSGTHSTIPKKVGFAGLQNYLPRQLDYLALMGADGVLIHDLDLFSLDRGIRRSFWSALEGRSMVASLESQALPAVPEPQLPGTQAATPCYVPGGSFETDRPLEWYIQSSWQTDRSSPVANGSFERYTDKHDAPRGWTLQRDEKSVISGLYDWKVMHDDPTSGRTFHGRSSVMLQATGESRDEPEACTAAWQAEFPIVAPLTEQLAGVQVHGEELQGIASVGMQLELLDSDGAVLQNYKKEGPADGTFVWQPITIPCSFNDKVVTVRVSLFMTAELNQPSQGRVWFDRFAIRPQAQKGDLADGVTTIQRTVKSDKSDKASERAHLLVRMEPGHDLVSIPFRVEKPGKYLLQVTLRSTIEQEIQLLWQGNKTFQRQATVDRAGTTLELPIELSATEPAARIVLRPTKESAIELKPLVLKQGGE